MAKKNSPQQGLNQLEAVLDEYLVKKAPALPNNIKELIVQFAPWLIGLGLLMSLPAVLALIGVGSLFGSFSYLGYYGYRVGGFGGSYMISMIFMVISLVLEAMALPGLFAKSRKGWQMLFYATLVSAVSSLLSFNIGGLIIGTLLGMYLLFQVKSYYK